MVDYIYEELKANVKLPSMTIDEIFVSDETFLNRSDSDILRHCSTKQVINMTADEVKEILNEKNIPLPEFLIDYDDGKYETDTSKYENVTDGYQLSEYFGNENLFIPTFDYFRAVKFGGIDFIMNIYNGKNANIPFKQVNDKIKIESDEEIKDHDGLLPFPVINDTIKYVKFTDTAYNPNIRIHQYPYKFPTLCINLPFEYYGTQDIPENIFSWDIDNKIYCFTNKKYDEVLEIFNNICKKGITTPLYFHVSQGKLVSACDDDYIKLLIAQYLKIPTIPVVLYMLKNDDVNKLLNSMRPSDIITARRRNYYADKEAYDILNNICKPYFMFYNKLYIEPVETIVSVDIPDSEDYNGPVYQHIEDVGSDVNDSYLLSNGWDKHEDRNDLSNISIEELHKRLKQEVDSSIQNDVNQSLKNLEYLNN